MPESYDFEKQWLHKLNDAVEGIAEKGVLSRVLKGSENLTLLSPRHDVIDWTTEAVEKLESLIEKEKTEKIMTMCACRYPTKDLQKARETWEETRDIDMVLDVLQNQFESFIRNSIGLSQKDVDYIVSRNMGLAGIRKGNTIIATKIPKSGSLKEYLSEKDNEKRKGFYCHCPRVRDAIKTGNSIPPVYCYCVAGFYKGVWEDILQTEVEVEIIESLFAGGDVCRIAIYLPD